MCASLVAVTSSCLELLELTDDYYDCEIDTSTNTLTVATSCVLTDEDIEGGYVEACLDNVGRENVIELYMHENAFTTLPAGIFQDLTNVTVLTFQRGEVTTLPEGVFVDLPALEEVYLDTNFLTTLPAGLFQNVPALRHIDLEHNFLSTLPEGVFEDLTSLEYLDLRGNPLECLPATNLEIPMYQASLGSGVSIDSSYGAECGCSIPDLTDNVCGEETCTPGPVGYTCGADTAAVAEPGTTPAPAPQSGARFTTSELDSTQSPNSSAAWEVTPTPVPSPTPAAGASPAAGATPSPRPTPQPTLAPNSNADGTPPLPTLAPHFDIFSTTAPAAMPSQQRSTSDSTPIVAGVVSAAAGAFLVALAVVFKRRRASKQKVVKPHPENLDQGRDLPQDDQPPSYAAMVAVRNGGDEWPSIATTSTANASTHGSAERSKFHHHQRGLTDAACVGGGRKSSETSGGDNGASSTAACPTTADDIGLGHAVLAAAQELAHHCLIPGVSEAAAAVCIMANLVTDSRDMDSASDARLRQCRSIVAVLERAAKVIDKGGDTTGNTARVLIEEVHDSIFDLVELIKTFQSKKKLAKLFLSTLFKRRQDELEAVVDRAIMRLQLGLQLQVGHDVSAVKDMVKEGMHRNEGFTAEATSEAVADARSVRRRRKLDQVEIPEDHVFITGDLLGKGGFGEVYLADYNGHNAAAKVLPIAHDLGALDKNQKLREASRRRAFLRELEAMIRLRGPNTVNVFGAVTSLPDRMVLVMELLVGGDLLTLLKKSTEPLPEKESRRIIGDICTGMAFLHSKSTVHGDLKSANVLLDGGGRAKIGDFGTSRWSHHTNSTGLATYTTKSSQGTQMSLAWSAPEVLESEASTYASDVYSFGIVVWEVVSRQLPWANKTRPREILSAVLRGVRPSFRVDAPADIVDIAKACWGGEAEERTTFGAILAGMKANGWSM